MTNQPRYTKVSMSPLGIAHMHKRNPWVAAACSVALPGLGHFYCGAYLRGFILMSWEIAVNQFGRINLAIFLTVMGHLDKAQAVMDYRWGIIYPVFYVLSIWDAYRVAAAINKLVEIEERQPDRRFPSPLAMSWYEFTVLTRRNPWMAAFLSLFLGGGGHFYNAKHIKAIMLMSWHLAIWLNSGLNRALIATAHGEWGQVHQLIDYQWLLFWPSIHMFNVWNAYNDCVELNKLCEEEMEMFLRHVTEVEPAAAPPPPGVPAP
jgi:hypothetical protein